MSLETFWFIVVAFFWTGFFVLEGFDFGVGMLHTIVGRNDRERRTALNAIGPFWDGNEVWLIVAGAGDVRGVPRLVRDDVLRPLPRAAAAAGGADRARGRVRVPRQGRRRRAGSGRGRGRRRSAAARSRCCSASGSATSSPGCRSTPNRSITGSVADMFTALRRLDRADAAGAVACCTARRSWRLKTEGAVRERSRALGVRLGRGRRRRVARLRRLVAVGAERARGRGRARRGAPAARGPRGLGVRRDRGRDGRHGQLAVRRSLSRT